MTVATSCKILFSSTLVILLAACANTDQNVEQASHDGLVKVSKSEFKELYTKPGATLSSYTEFGLEKCEVAFKKNWLRDQNQSRIDLSSRVTQEDVDKMKESLSAACNAEFAAALLEAPAYNVVDNFDDGKPVLVLKPSIINLNVNAPDVQSTSMSRTYTTSAGEMTLVLELLDGTTGELLARAIDRQRAMDTGTVRWSSSISNKAEADRMLRRWAKLLREGLDEATAK